MVFMLLPLCYGYMYQQSTPRPPLVLVLLTGEMKVAMAAFDRRRLNASFSHPFKGRTRSHTSKEAYRSNRSYSLSTSARSFATPTT